MTFFHHTERLPTGRVTRHALLESDAPLSTERFWQAMATSAEWRARWASLLAESEYRSFRWETPVLTRATAQRAFECVLVDDPYLDVQPEPDVFREHFDAADPKATVVAVPNLGRTATLVVPRPLADDAAYPHIAAFVRQAPAAQVDALWRCVAQQVLTKLSDTPLWVSTAGGGVAWLHVRLEGVPKYYAHRPYRVGP